MPQPPQGHSIDKKQVCVVCRTGSFWLCVIWASGTWVVEKCEGALIFCYASQVLKYVMNIQDKKSRKLTKKWVSVIVYSFKCRTDVFISMAHFFAQSTSWRSSVTLPKRAGERVEGHFGMLYYRWRSGTYYNFTLCHDLDLCTHATPFPKFPFYLTAVMSLLYHCLIVVVLLQYTSCTHHKHVGKALWSATFHVIPGVLYVTAVWKLVWSIPGSVI